MQLVLEIVAIVAFALSGAVVAIRRGFDVVGLVVLAECAALGGGVLRDVLLGAAPVAALERPSYLLVPLAAAALAFVAHPLVERSMSLVVVLDAAGLGFYVVQGVLKALDAGVGPVGATVVGFVTGVGGGLIRDLLAGETPVIVRADSTLYAIPAFLGALAVAVTHAAGGDPRAAAVPAALLVFAVRVIAVSRGWRAPPAVAQRPAGRAREDQP